MTALGILLTSITIKQAPSCNAILLPNLLVDPVDEYIQSSFRKTQPVKKSLGPVPAARASDTRLPSDTHLPSGPRSHCCRGAGLPAGMGKFSPASRMCSYCPYTSNSLRANTCGARRAPYLSPADPPGTGVSRTGPNAGLVSRGEGQGAGGFPPLRSPRPGGPPAAGLAPRDQAPAMATRSPSSPLSNESSFNKY